MSRRDTALRYFDEYRDFMELVVKPNIEIYRKGACKLTVTAKDGTPIEGARVVLRQKNHAFRYGANIFMLDEFENEEKNAIYREKFKELFNLATLPFYWSDLEPIEGKPRFAKDSPKIYRRPAPDLCVEYCQENGIEPKCHCLNYDNYAPEWVIDADVETHKKKLDRRFREIAERYADAIPSFEVTNETFNDYSHRQSRFYKADDFVEWSFRTADRYFPNNRLIINDYFVFDRYYRENRSAYYMQIERLLREGITHLDSVGIQFHSFFPQCDEWKMAKTHYNPVYLYEVLDIYKKLGKKLQITEMTIPAYSGSEEDEEIQAELLKNLYTVFFSHPAMEAVIYWNLVDGYAAFAPQGDMTAGENKYHGGFMRFDMSEKPAFRVIRDLFAKEWRTDTEIATGADGTASFRGFYGDYEVRITVDGKEYTKKISLLDNANNEYRMWLD